MFAESSAITLQKLCTFFILDHDVSNMFSNMKLHSAENCILKSQLKNNTAQNHTSSSAAASIIVTKPNLIKHSKYHCSKITPYQVQQVS